MSKKNQAKALRTYTTKHGTAATMRTENIGRRKKPGATRAEEIDALGNRFAAFW